MTAVPENYFARGVRLLEHFGDEGHVKVRVDGDSPHFLKLRDMSDAKHAGCVSGVFGASTVRVECERYIVRGREQPVDGVFLITFTKD